MPAKKKVLQKQKQRQRQSVVVNVNVAKARAKSSAKKSGKSGGRGGGGGYMLPPPIYASPIDRLSPAMYGSQGQQIKEQNIEQLLKNFLSNQQNQQVGSFKTLGSAQESALPSKSEWLHYYPGSSSVSYNPSLSSQDDVSEISEDSLNTEWERYNKYTNIGEEIRRDEIQDLKGSQLREQFNKFKNKIPTPFQNEEKSYLSVAEPDYESTAPKFSQNEARASQQNIYESLKQFESSIVRDENLIKQLQEGIYSPNKSSPSKTNIIPFDDLSSLKSNDSLASYAGMYGPRVPINRAEQESYFKKIADDSSSGSYYD